MAQTEITIAAQCDDDFDELCERVEALCGVVVKATRSGATFDAVLVRSFAVDPDANQVTVRFDLDALRLCNVTLAGRETLAAVENITRH